MAGIERTVSIRVDTRDAMHQKPGNMVASGQCIFVLSLITINYKVVASSVMVLLSRIFDVNVESIV